MPPHIRLLFSVVLLNAPSDLMSRMQTATPTLQKEKPRSFDERTKASGSKPRADNKDSKDIRRDQNSGGRRDETKREKVNTKLFSEAMI